MKFYLKLLVINLILSSILFAQNNNGFVLLKMDVDARAAAMAGTYTALATDASASYYNPAGLNSSEGPTIVAMHNDWIWDISHSFAAMQFYQGDHNFSLSFNYLQIPGIAIRGNVPSEDPSGTTEAFNLVAGLSYATTFDDWQFGGSLKYLFEKYYLSSAPGWAVDLGIRKEALFTGVDFGFVIQNLGKMSVLKNEASPLPVIIQTALAFKGPEFLSDKLLFTPGIQWVSKEQVYFGIGSEYQLMEYLTLRAGVKNGVDDVVWNFGAGINYNSFHFDYAYSPLEFDFGNPANMFSVGISY
ncbi:MAG: hypothetical protein D8M58_18915 [Calditrichaeota bacterium]|nr:MAG: hypothetical protein DWQ03_21595 [Calditrichota bacterium]MBL1207482.1 hypothetical protein [Calditrichota bacterium]NOG47314.1 PorV/PorQ family protein [Calditrichota bacterium]